MRKFDYTKDYTIVGTTIRGYILQMEKELSLLSKTNSAYNAALAIIKDFQNKYPNLGYTSGLILDELLSSENVEYCFKYGKYPPDASKVGLEFEKDLKKILILEDELRELAIQSWETELTKFDDIVNGENFMIVGHAADLLPGTTEFKNYRTGIFSKQYLSCSLLSQNELNTFMGIKTVYIAEVNGENYISASSFDTVTSESKEGFDTVKTIEENGNLHHINVGYSHDTTKGVTTISTPLLIDYLSVERKKEEQEKSRSKQKFTVNEVVLDRTTTKIKGAILFSNGCDLLVENYIYLKENNIKFKCINKSLYKKGNEPLYDEEEYLDFLKKLSKLEEKINLGHITPSTLLTYYQEVIIPMKYSEEIQNMIKETFSKYIEIPSYGTR